MYGLVNKAVQDLVTSQFGEEKWSAIKERSGLDIDYFLAMKTYPDKVTYDLVAAASEVLELTSEQVLQAFGEYWTLFIAKEGYNGLLQMAGDSLFAVLQKLDELHTRLSLSFPELRPPSFSCSEITDTSMHFHYYSERPGLGPFVMGLIHGLAKVFKNEIDLSYVKCQDQGHDHDEFFIRLKG